MKKYIQIDVAVITADYKTILESDFLTGASDAGVILTGSESICIEYV